MPRIGVNDSLDQFLHFPPALFLGRKRPALECHQFARERVQAENRGAAASQGLPPGGTALRCGVPVSML